jgi:RIO kinase 1
METIVFTAPGRPPRPEPTWLITDDFEQNDVGPLTTGKEAEIFVVERTSPHGSCWLVHKRYRPRQVTQKGQLQAMGFQRAPTFANDHQYRDGRKAPRRTRDRRAIERMTNYGKTLLNERWSGHEYEMMRRAWDAGADVPFPVSESEEGMLMEYLGDEAGAAPQLARARLGPDELRIALDQLVSNMALLLDVGIVHSDLSPYNVLWWNNRVQLIDFPQAVDLVVNPHAFDFLHRDVTNVCRFFQRRRIDCDVDALYNDLLDGWTPS